MNTTLVAVRVGLTRAKWLDDLLAIQSNTGYRGLAVVEGGRGSYTRFTRPGDRPGADTGPGLPEANFVVVGAGYEDDGHVLCSLARRLVGNYRRRHGWRSSCKRVGRSGTIGHTPTLVWNNLPSDHDHLPSLAAFAPNSPATWPNGFLTCTQKPGYRALFHASTSLPQRGIL